ncbi:hypothetical protein BDQ12DRAFT_679041 [Crucibulum laeve]|uniref:Uncharacterized protein n=1 Tax=Crucibulum laeve TaxID=68775 RepID=A0A5C3M8K3_9AGAR|nr:hypothetical protein BDQ12DRAFT_679041 [Crucibulum laeve]
MVRQVEAPQGRRKATKEEINAFKTWEYTRKENGQPPWIGRDGRDTLQADKSSHNLRQLADEYAASPKILKELVYEKVVHGWDISKLEQAIRGAIAETQYRGSVNVAFQLSSTRICIRPDNKLSRLLSRTFYKVLLCIFLIYPFIWLFKRYHSRGGGRWEIYGGAYGLKHIEPLSTDELENAIPDMEPPSLRPRIISTELGLTRIIGLREGEWFKEWEPIIKRSVAIGLERSEPMKQTQDGPISPAHALDGYTPPRLEGY